MAVARPLQIIATGDSEHDFFVLNKENLAAILSKVPPHCKVAVVSVVGAFRTGKSFLLNFFLRYLRSDAPDSSSSWMVSEGEELTEGNMNEGWNLVDAPADQQQQQQQQQLSFQWRGGKERQTTGIWMWSHPFVRKSTAEGDLAVLLMDTQGMFDNETTMTLTAQIFGLSTLVSSFQIYNVDKRIQEDNLQHLALFSEYGRMALESQHPDSNNNSSSSSSSSDNTSQEQQQNAVLSLDAARAGLPPVPPAASEERQKETAAAAASNNSSSSSGDNDKADADADTPPPVPPAATTTTEAATVSSAAAKKARSKQSPAMKPFQHLQFLVRDWQNFEDDLEDDPPGTAAAVGEAGGTSAVAAVAVSESQQKFQSLRAEMQAYLSEVLRARGLGDLQSTREQITRCFDTLDCFMLPHPGFAVTKKNYDGAISKIEPFFRALVNKYVRQIFDEQLVAKQINGRSLTGRELQTYIEVYVEMFQAGQKSFPKAMTMLDATAEANNRNAFDIALDAYKHGMDNIAGPDKGYVKEEELQKEHDLLYIAAFDSFDEMATMGAPSLIEKMRLLLKSAVQRERERYFHTNSLRNPFKDAELYLAAFLMAAVAWFVAVIVNATCSTDFCEDTEDTFVNIYLFIFFVMLAFAWRHIQGALLNLQRLLPVLMEGVGAQADKLKKH